MFFHPPLPFYGNKSNLRNNIINIVTELPDDLLFIDLFGGSFYLSYLIKSIKPKANVICNDYDYYINRLLILIKQINYFPSSKNVFLQIFAPIQRCLLKILKRSNPL